jgi:hypothetical protein
MKTKRYWLRGLIVGLILAIINILKLGAPGFIFSFVVPLKFITGCSGEECWGPMIILGSVGFIVLSTLFGWLYGKIINRNQ